MKKILFIIDSLNSGGAEKSLVNLLNELDYSNYEIDLQLFSNNNFFLNLIPDNVNVLKLPNYFNNCKFSISQLLMKRKFKLFFYRIKTSIVLRRKNGNMHILQRQWQSIRNTIEKNKKYYDVVIAYSQGIPTYYAVEKTKAKRKYAWINCLYSNTQYNKKIDYSYYKKINKIVVVSDTSKEDIINIFPDMKNKVIVIYDFISKKIVEAMGKEEFVWNDQFKGVRISSILRMEWVKGPDIVIECCRMLNINKINFKWYIIGTGGSMYYKIIKLIKEYHLEDNVVLVGPLLNPFKMVTHTDLYVQSSRVEGYCMALAEARLLNIAIISTNFKLVNEHIIDNVTGLICQQDPKDMYDKIIKFINDPDLRNKTIKNRIDNKHLFNKEITKFYKLVNE